MFFTQLESTHRPARLKRFEVGPGGHGLVFFIPQLHFKMAASLLADTGWRAKLDNTVALRAVINERSEVLRSARPEGSENMGFEMPITIQKVVNEIKASKYVLPAIQREFVWSAEQVENLFDSLLRGYPIGSFLSWRVLPERIGDFQFYRFMDHYHERDYRRNEPIAPPSDREITAVLDGQQRLTALYIGLSGTYADKLPRGWWRNDDAFPKRELYINLKRPVAQDGEPPNGFEIRFLKKSDAQCRDGSKFWFRVGNILTFPDMQDVFNWCVDERLTEGGDKYSPNTLIQLWRVVMEKPLVNYFLEEEQDLNKVLNIFIRVNSGGTQLSYSDMLLSIATAQWRERDARQDIYSLVDRLNSVGDRFNFDKDYVLKASLVLTDVADVQFRVNNFNKDNMLKIESKWDAISDALWRTTQLISGWGYNWQTLPSAYATIPLAYYLYQKGSPSNLITAHQYAQDRELMRHWLRVALLKRTFSGTPDNVLRQIRRAMQGARGAEGFPADAIYQELAPTSRSMSFDQDELEGLFSYRYEQSYAFTVLAMLYPWLKYDQQFHMDHVFPRAMFNKRELRRRGIPEGQWPLWLEQVNNLANLQLLHGPINQSKSDQEFERWIKGECPTPSDLSAYKELHLIPDADLSFEHFPQFVEARTKLMRECLAELLGVRLTNRAPNG